MSDRGKPPKIAFISATSIFALATAAHLLERPQLAGGAELALYSPPEEEADLAVIADAVRLMAEGKGIGLRVTSTTDRPRVLDGAAFVVTALRAGRLEAHRLDIELPQEFGIYQVVGDTVNPGGIFAALRNYGVIGAIAEDMKRYSKPGAWIINMSNPEGSICRMVHEGHGVPVVGLCPGIYGLKRRLAGVLEVSEERLEVEISGFNHLTWVTRLELDGEDAYPLLRQKLSQGGLQGQPISALALDVFGLYPAPSDGHVAEFFHEFSLSGPDDHRYGLKMRNVDAMLASRASNWSELRSRIAQGTPPGTEGYRGTEDMGGFQIADVIEGFVLGSNRTVQVNIRNDAAIPNLPPDAFVEVPAMIDRSRVTPKSVGPLPDSVAGILCRIFAQQKLIVRAALQGDRQAVVQALALDPALRRLEDASPLAERMIEAHRQYLPMFG